MATTAADQQRQRMLIGLLVASALFAGWFYRDSLFGGWQADPLDTKVANVSAELRQLQELPLIPTAKPVSTGQFLNRRNLFEFGIDPALAAKRRQEELARQQRQQEQEAIRKAQQDKRAAEQRKPRQPPKPAAPKAPDFRYRYMAYINRLPDQQYMAVLQSGNSAKKDDLQIVKVGDLIDEKFVIKSIDIDAIEIGYTDPKFKDKTTKVDIAQATAQKGGSSSRRRRR